MRQEKPEVHSLEGIQPADGDSAAGGPVPPSDSAWTDQSIAYGTKQAGSETAGGGPYRSALQSTASLAALAEDVVSSADAASVPQAHLGADLASSAQPRARRLQQLGASFEWLAFSQPGTSMWDRHVGVVSIGDGAFEFGIHLSDTVEAAGAQMHRLAEILGRPVKHSAEAAEYQVVAECLELPGQHREAVHLSLGLYRQLVPTTGRAPRS